MNLAGEELRVDERAGDASLYRGPRWRRLPRTVTKGHGDVDP